jgi:hypothetical protein
MTGPLPAAILVAHVVAVVCSYGALGATGAFARLARTAVDPFSSDQLRRFFRPGHNLAGRLLYVVPLLGFALLLAQPTSDFTRAYPWIGLAIWTVSIVIATGSLWPAEAEVQTLIAAGRAPGARTAVRDACRRVERASIALVVCFLGAFVVMVARV